MDESKLKQSDRQIVLAAQAESFLAEHPEIRDTIARVHADALAGRVVKTVTAEALLASLDAETRSPDIT